MNDPFRANNYYDAAKRLDGTSAPGNVRRSVVRVGYKQWEIRDTLVNLIRHNITDDRVSFGERLDNILTMWGFK